MPLTSVPRMGEYTRGEADEGLLKSLYYLNDALKREPKNEDFLMERSNVYVDVGQIGKAIKDLTDALFTASPLTLRFCTSEAGLLQEHGV